MRDVKSRVRANLGAIPGFLAFAFRVGARVIGAGLESWKAEATGFDVTYAVYKRRAVAVVARRSMADGWCAEEDECGGNIRNKNLKPGAGLGMSP